MVFSLPHFLPRDYHMTCVFLVSVKLIIMAYRNSVSVGHLNDKLDTILAKLSKPLDKNRNTEGKSQDQSDPE